MGEFFHLLFSTQFMPHVYCLREPALIALHAISDGLIALSYFLIPLALILLVRRRHDLVFRWAYLLFGVFILACGATHTLSVVTLWHPFYWLEGALKAITALLSLATAVLLLRLLPLAAALPGPAQLRHAEDQVRKLNAELEIRVRERTAQLESANTQLAEFAASLDKTQTIIQKLDGTILYWNTGAESMYGWSRDEALGRKSHELLRTELPQPLSEMQAELLKRGSWSGEFRQQCRNGTSIWVASYWALHRDAAGKPVSVVKVNNDITELKRAHEALRTSEATAHSLFENAGQGILTVDQTGLITDANAMAQGLFGYNRTELIGAPVEMLLPENLHIQHVAHRSSFPSNPHSRPKGQGMDLMAHRKDGSDFPVQISLSFVAEHPSGGLAMAFISDISARKQAHREKESMIAKLEYGLSEKIVLLKEVHHRVKNNLAVISGLLGMQADAFGDERLRAALEESQQRVASMALIHEYLYASEHLDRVNFGEYVQRLTKQLQTSYTTASDLITVAIETEEIDLPVHRAIPCGLILNELVSNALKHAFPDKRSGTIKVSFVRLDTGELSLCCCDNGVGIRKGMDLGNLQSLGLKIVQILTKQIGGRFRLDCSAGETLFELTFPSLNEELNQALPALASAIAAAKPALEPTTSIVS